MFLYFLFLFFAILPVLFFRNRKGLFASCLMIAIFFSLRCDIGDYPHYHDLWIKVHKLTWNYFFTAMTRYNDYLENHALHSEYGYIVVQKLFPLNFLWFIAATTFLLIGAFHMLIRRYVDKEYYPWSLLLLADPIILMINGSAIRQGTALAFLIFALCAFLDKRYVICAILFTMGVFFHKSLIPLICIFPAIHMLKESNMKWLWMAIVLIVLPLGMIFSRYMMSQFNFYEHYYTSGSKVIMSILLSLPIILALIRIEKADYPVRALTFIYSLILYCRIICLLPGMSMINRYTLYFDAFSVVALPMLIPRLPHRSRWLFCCFMALYVISRSIAFTVNPTFIGEISIDLERQNIFVSGDNFKTAGDDL